MDVSSTLNWTTTPPDAFDIVTAYFPEREPSPDGSIKLRPTLVLNVLKGKTSGRMACRVAYGTKILKLRTRGHLDLTIQNSADLDFFGLPYATRFDLDNVAVLPWTEDFFGCWSGYSSPRLSALTETYVKELAWLMMSRGSR